MTNPKKRARELGLPLPGVTGRWNSITDVPGVEVGFKTLSSHGNGDSKHGELPIQTGVTAILPRGHATEPSTVWAGQHTLNGNGEMTGVHWIKDAGWTTGPILITNSHSVGMVHHGATKWMLAQYGEAWRNNHLWALPVVAETYDGVLNDINGLHVTGEDAVEALDTATSGPVEEGNIGGGTGMICYEYKGGTGTSSRKIRIDGKEFTIGVLVQANHGVRPWLKVLGKHLGPSMNEDRIPGLNAERGSIIVVIATDLPLAPNQLNRLARRATLGIGQTGSPGGNNSGDIFLAFSTANKMDLPQLSGAWRQMEFLNDELLDVPYQAVVEATDESILNAMLMAQDTPTARPTGHICRAIDSAELVRHFQ